jgi:hypothetical protein
MLANAREYKIYLPLTYPDGKPIEAEKRYAVRTRLVERFGGVTTVRQTNYLEGFWLSEEEVIPDQIVIYTSVDLRHPGMENETFMLEYKDELKREFRQQEVFITVSDLQII